MQPPDAPVAKLVGLARGSRRWIEKEIARLVGLNRDARECFCGEDGKLTGAAQRLFARMAKEAQLDRIGFDPDARHQDYRKGWQDAVRFLGKMVELDTARLEELQRKMGDR